MQGKYDEAMRIYDQCLAIREKAFGPSHQCVATTLNSMASLLYHQVNGSIACCLANDRSWLTLIPPSTRSRDSVFEKQEDNV